MRRAILWAAGSAVLVFAVAPAATATRQLRQGDQAQPLALVAGDFDEDGVADLLSGFDGPDGGISGFDSSYLSSQGGDSCAAPP